MVARMSVDWNRQLAEQLDWHWQNRLRPRLDGLTDEEYFWEPAPGCWSVRRHGHSKAPVAVGAGEFAFEFAYPAPDPAPVTTIAWRLAQIIVGSFAARNGSHFGGPKLGNHESECWRNFTYAGTAEQALEQLDENYARWITGVRGLGAHGLARPCGPAEDPFGDEPMAMLVLHINREVIHHGAEIALLRDLYRTRHGLV
jgi:DinB superfamily